MADPYRASDPEVTLFQFSDLVWVHCPACDGPARITQDRGLRLNCIACGHLREVDTFPPGGSPIAMGPTPYWWAFDAPLYLKAKVAGEELWAYNLAHLDALDMYLGATLRERGAETALRNKTMMSRLPPWMKKASNRERIVKAIAKLREMAVAAGIT